MAERTTKEIQSDITAYRNWMQRRDIKYTRNFNRAVGNQAAKSSIWQIYTNPLAFYFAQTEEDTGILPVLNVIKSCLDTLVSKISQTKVRPFLNPINGTYQTYKICDNAQTFFDEFFQENNVYKKGVEAVLNSGIFEMGVIWIDESRMTVEPVHPWSFFFDPAEFHYGKLSGLTRCFLEFRDYPVSMLVKQGKKLSEKIRTAFETSPIQKCKYNIYYDLVNKQRIEFIDDVETDRIALDTDVCPFEVIFYNEPVKGSFSTSLVDDLYPIQTQIDTLVHRIHTAAELNPANTIFIPSSGLGEGGAGIKKSSFSNKIATLISYDASIGGGPVTVSTPRFIDPSYQESLDYFINKAYEITGISQLSAQAKKPAGLNSGVALDTYQDVESERWNVLLQNYIRLMMGVAIKMIEIFPDDADIIPKRRGVQAIKWKDVKRARKEYSLQFSPASVLSNDPETKMQQIEKMLSMKFINQTQANKLLEFPDLNGAFNVLNASYDDCQVIIQRAVEDEVYTFYESVNLQELYTEIITMINRLDSNNEKPEVIDRLIILMNKVKHQLDQCNQVIAPPQAPNTPPPPVMQGQQITAITEILKDVKSGAIDSHSATLFLQMAFPEVPANLIQQMVSSSTPASTNPPSIAPSVTQAPTATPPQAQ